MYQHARCSRHSITLAELTAALFNRNRDLVEALVITGQSTGDLRADLTPDDVPTSWRW